MASPFPLNESSHSSFTTLVQRDAPEHAERIKGGFEVLSVSSITPKLGDYRNTLIHVRYTTGETAYFRYRRLDLSETYGATTVLTSESGALNSTRLLTLFSQHHQARLTEEDVSVSDTAVLTDRHDCLITALPDSIVYIGHCSVRVNTPSTQQPRYRLVEENVYLATEDGRPRVLEGDA